MEIIFAMIWSDHLNDDYSDVCARGHNKHPTIDDIFFSSSEQTYIYIFFCNSMNVANYSNQSHSSEIVVNSLKFSDAFNFAFIDIFNWFFWIYRFNELVIMCRKECSLFRLPIYFILVILIFNIIFERLNVSIQIIYLILIHFVSLIQHLFMISFSLFFKMHIKCSCTHSNVISRIEILEINVWIWFKSLVP